MRCHRIADVGPVGAGGDAVLTTRPRPTVSCGVGGRSSLTLSQGQFPLSSRRVKDVIELREEPIEAASGPRERTVDDGVVISRGTRVFLRTFTRADLDHLASWVDDPFLERMVGSEFLHAFKHDWDKAPAFHEAVMNDASQVVLMVEANRGWAKPVGVVRLFNIHLLEGYAFLETIISDQRAMRRGYGVEAGKLISYYGLDVLGLRRLEAKVYAYNVLSMNTLRRNGFHQEGVLRQAGFDGTRYWDVIVFGILRDEVEAVRKRDKVYLPLDAPEGNVIEPT
jgi:ribosomal-protein-alanine N-acetyltransferase